jgi:hypothetical protein
VHGYAHRNHAGAGEKKAEFGPQRPLAVLAQEAQAALLAAQDTLGPKLLPVFVPPWNRMAPMFARELPSLGFAGLSSFRDRDPTRAVDGLTEGNTHLDPIDWRGSRSALPPEVLIAAVADAVLRRLDGGADRDEPIGLLTHHLVHDEAVWRFCEALLDELARNGLALAGAELVFSGDNRIAVGL